MGRQARRHTRYHSPSPRYESHPCASPTSPFHACRASSSARAQLAKLPKIACGYGKHALLVTGAGSFKGSPFWPAVTTGLQAQGMSWFHFTVPGEPSPQMIDEAVRTLRARPVDVVIGIGGGSALDAAKAIAGLLKPGNSVMDHLEGVGPELPYAGPATPFIAVPTTAGTGSEATKNAVLSVQGKTASRNPSATTSWWRNTPLVDPDLLATCPRAGHRGERHGRLHPAAGVLRLQPGFAAQRFARLGRHEGRARRPAGFI